MIAPAFFALAFGSQLLMTVADEVPAFDSAPGCRAATTVTPGSFESCMNDEQTARGQLATLWGGFPASARAACAANETIGGTPSYVELLTCLQMEQGARALPADETDGSSR